MVRIKDNLEPLVHLQTGEKRFLGEAFAEGDVSSDPDVPCQW